MSAGGFVGAPPGEVVRPPLLDLAPDMNEEPPPAKFPDLVEGVFPAVSTNIQAGPQDAGKTAFAAWELAEMERGELLGHKAHLPPWRRVFVFDRSHEDWAYWCEQAEIECPRGYWVLDDPVISINTIRSWKDSQTVINFWETKLLAMKPEPGGLIITDGGLDLIGDGTIKYFDAYANMVAIQRITRRLKLTHLLICHAGKPKTLGNRDAKARDIDKANANAGALGSADTLCYLSCAAELAEAGVEAPPYQRFSWVPHHAPAEEFYLKRTSNGLFERTLPAQDGAESGAPGRPTRRTKAEREQEERVADAERAKLVGLILDETPTKRMEGAEVARVLQARFKLSQSGAYRVIRCSKDLGIAFAEGRLLCLVISTEKSNG